MKKTFIHRHHRAHASQFLQPCNRYQCYALYGSPSWTACNNCTHTKNTHAHTHSPFIRQIKFNRTSHQIGEQRARSTIKRRECASRCRAAIARSDPLRSDSQSVCVCVCALEQNRNLSVTNGSSWVWFWSQFVVSQRADARPKERLAARCGMTCGFEGVQCRFWNVFGPFDVCRVFYTFNNSYIVNKNSFSKFSKCDCLMGFISYIIRLVLSWSFYDWRFTHLVNK